MSNGELVSVLPKPRQVRVAAALIAVPALLAVLVLLRGLAEGWFTNPLGLVGGAISASALAAGVSTLRLRQGAPRTGRTTAILCTINLVAMGALGAVGGVLALSSSAETGDHRGVGAIGMTIFTMVAVVGLTLAAVNTVALHLLTAAPAARWFEGEASPKDAAADPTPLAGRALPAVLIASGAASLLYLAVIRGTEILESPARLPMSVTDPGYLGAYAGILVGALTPWVVRGVRAARTVATVAAMLAAVIWCLFTISGLISLPAGTEPGALVGSILLAAADLAVVVLLTRAEPVPAHDDATN